MRSVNQILTNLLYLSPDRSLLYVTNTLDSGQPTHVFEQFSCFLPGLLALGVHSLPPSAFATEPGLRNPALQQLLTSYNLSDLHMWAALGLGESCWLMYADQPTGLGPEEIFMRTQGTSFDQEDDTNLHNRISGSGLWIYALEDWRLGGEHGVPPGLEPKSPVSDLAERDYVVRKAEYLLRPEVRSWLKCCGCHPS